MMCEKTGAQIYIEQYEMYALCDAYVIVGNHRLFRISEMFHEPIRDDVLHYTISQVDHWFDRDVARIVTMISNLNTFHGADGIDIDSHKSYGEAE